MIIPIRGATPGTSPEALQEQINAGFRALGVSPESVRVEAHAWPAIHALLVNLSGAAVESFEDFPRLEGKGEGSLRVEQLWLSGRPITLRALPLFIEVQARAATLEMTRLSGSRHALVLRKAADGNLDLSAQRGELERLAHTLLAGLAKKHGADLVQTKLHFTPRGSRALSFQAEITAKVMMMKAPISVAGDLDLSDDLQLRISNLRLTGSGMAASLARGFLQPQFEKIQQKPISLAALALGEIRLRDVAVAVEGETLRISAKFGS